MKYADYKIENLVFMKGTDGWSIEEKKEFLESCPENADLKNTIEDLKQLNEAIIDGIVKRNTYGEINKSSIKAYINKHETNIRYGRPSSRHYFYSDDSKDIYVYVDGSYSLINRGWEVNSLIEKLTDDKYIEKRFDTLARVYAEKENKWSKQVEDDRYTATHTEQIAANKKLDLLMDALDIQIPTGFKEGHFGRLECKKAQLRRGDYWYSHNDYGEIMVNKVPLTEKQATELTDMILEMSGKIVEIMDEYRADINKMMGKKVGA